MSEGMPLTVLEAMASGLPVIATAVGGIQEIVQQDQTGWLCPPSNPPILAETMLTAAASQQRIVMGDRGRQHVMSKFSIAQMADEYERLFGRVLALRNKRS
jgi:glycosyltransferase involved in cell wall biosynthesis